MTARRNILTILLSILLLSAASAEDYQLNWEQVDTSPAPASKNYTLDWKAVDRRVDRATPAQRLQALRKRAQANRPVVAPQPQFRKSVWKQPQPAPVPTYNIEITASQFWDAYAERYLQVQAVQVATIRNGRCFTETFENVAQFRAYDVYLNDLRQGDSYEVTVVWDNGSNRTVERTLGSHVERSISIDEPDCLAYAVW